MYISIIDTYSSSVAGSLQVINVFNFTEWNCLNNALAVYMLTYVCVSGFLIIFGFHQIGSVQTEAEPVYY